MSRLRSATRWGHSLRQSHAHVHPPLPRLSIISGAPCYTGRLWRHSRIQCSCCVVHTGRNVFHFAVSLELLSWHQQRNIPSLFLLTKGRDAALSGFSCYLISTWPVASVPLNIMVYCNHPHTSPDTNLCLSRSVFTLSTRWRYILCQGTWKQMESSHLMFRVFYYIIRMLAGSTTQVFGPYATLWITYSKGSLQAATSKSHASTCGWRKHPAYDLSLFFLTT